MNLDHLVGRKNQGLDLDTADATVTAMLTRLADGYRRLLILADGIELASGALIYSSRELVERNDTYDVARGMPLHIAISDDGGGHMFLLREGPDSPVFRVGMGAIGSLSPDVIAESVEDWIEQGCPAKTPGEMLDANTPSFADVYLDVIPEGKLSNLIAVKNELGLDLSISEMKALASNLPARLAISVPYGKFRIRCNALNKRFGPCLSLRPS